MRIIPSTFSDGPRSERLVFQSLPGGSESDDWTVLHSVGWLTVRGGKRRSGEADFVAMHPRRGVLVIEVKGGTVAVEDGRWRTTPTGSNRPIPLARSPFRQAEDSRFTLQRHVREVLGGSVDFGHAVAFPTGDVSGPLGLDAPAEIIIDQTDLASHSNWLDRLSRFWDLSSDGFGRAEVQTLVDLLKPTASVTVSMASRLRDAEQGIASATQRQIELTDRQLATLRQLQQSPKAVIYGGPGTGKTLLAIERAKRLLTDESTVLLIAASHPVTQWIHSQLEDRHDQCTITTRETALGALRGPASEAELERTERLTELVGSFDALIVDEGQDFAREELAQLGAYFRDPDEGAFYVFADLAQRALHRAGEAIAPAQLPEGLIPLVLGENCRNTKEISELMDKTIGGTLEPARSTGPEVEFVKGGRADLAPAAAAAALKLLGEEVAADDIGVILPEPLLQEVGNHLTAALPPKVESLTVNLDYLLLGAIAPSRLDIGTPRSFLGLERSVVIAIVPPDLDARGLARFLFLSVSRARSLVIVIGADERSIQSRLRGSHHATVSARLEMGDAVAAELRQLTRELVLLRGRLGLLPPTITDVRNLLMAVEPTAIGVNVKQLLQRDFALRIRTVAGISSVLVAKQEPDQFPAERPETEAPSAADLTNALLAMNEIPFFSARDVTPTLALAWVRGAFGPAGQRMIDPDELVTARPALVLTEGRLELVEGPDPDNWLFLAVPLAEFSKPKRKRRRKRTEAERSDRAPSADAPVANSTAPEPDAGEVRTKAFVDTAIDCAGRFAAVGAETGSLGSLLSLLGFDSYRARKLKFRRWLELPGQDYRILGDGSGIIIVHSGSGIESDEILLPSPATSTVVSQALEAFDALLKEHGATMTVDVATMWLRAVLRGRLNPEGETVGDYIRRLPAVSVDGHVVTLIGKEPLTEGAPDRREL
jgi:hypothetical protein